MWGKESFHYRWWPSEVISMTCLPAPDLQCAAVVSPCLALTESEANSVKCQVLGCYTRCCHCCYPQIDKTLIILWIKKINECIKIHVEATELMYSGPLNNVLNWFKWGVCNWKNMLFKLKNIWTKFNPFHINQNSSKITKENAHKSRKMALELM